MIHSRRYIKKRVHFFAALLALSTTMAGAVYWIMALIMQFAVMVNGVEMESDPAMVAFIGSVLFVAAAPVTLRLAGRWVEIREVGGASRDN